MSESRGDMVGGVGEESAGVDMLWDEFCDNLSVMLYGAFYFRCGERGPDCVYVFFAYCFIERVEKK